MQYIVPWRTSNQHRYAQRYMRRYIHASSCATCSMHAFYHSRKKMFHVLIQPRNQKKNYKRTEKVHSANQTDSIPHGLTHESLVPGCKYARKLVRSAKISVFLCYLCCNKACRKFKDQRDQHLSSEKGCCTSAWINFLTRMVHALYVCPVFSHGIPSASIL